jgi:hypothetical protein
MLTLPRTLTFTPAQFAEVCAANPAAALVRTTKLSGPCCGLRSSRATYP